MTPRIHPAFGLHEVDEDTVVALSEARRTVLRLPGLGQVVRWLDGTRSAAAIADKLDGALSVMAVQGVIDALAERAYVIIDSAEAPRATTATPQVAVLATSDIDADRLQGCIDALHGAGIRICATAPLRIVLCNDLRHPDLISLCEQAEREGAVLLPVKASGQTPSIGPAMGPAEAACIHCLRYWIGTQRPMETWLERAQGSQTPSGQAYIAPPPVWHPHTDRLCLALLATMLQAPHADASGAPGPGTLTPKLTSSLLALDLRTLATSRHAVTKRPQCPHCGDPTWMQQQAWRMPALEGMAAHAAPARRSQASGTRRQSPEQTFAQYQHLISPITGPVCYLHPMPGRHGGMRQVFVSGYMVCPEPEDTRFVTDKVCAGKGATAEQARTSALCEALERFSGVHQGDEARTRATLAELGDAALPFNTLQQFSAAQFAHRDEINALSGDVRRHVPQPFTPQDAIDWTPAWSLTQGCWRQVPLVYCYAQTPFESGRAFGIHNPNGTAAGTSVAEALLQGTLELIERDATAIWWYNRLPRPPIDLDSFADPYFTQLRADYAQLGWQLWVLDLTHDLRIPVCVAVAWHPTQDRHALGFGCHLDPHLAVRRALTEVNQLFDARSAGPDPWDRSLLPDTGFLHPWGRPDSNLDAGQPARHADQMAQDGRHFAQADPLETCRQAFAEQGLAWLMVDKTRPDIGLNVVQAIVPGLRHFWPRFGPGRLYDVPVAMGWLAQPCDEAALNPAPLFL